MPKARDADKIERLRSLADTPEEQFDYALQLVEAESHQEVVQAALDVLAATADPRARRVMLEKYDWLDAEGTRRDAGCYLRTALLRALRYLAQRRDAPLLERAVLTYEFMQPGPTEVAAGLRSVALVTLNEVDETLAGYYSVRLLTDLHTSHMSGEPAVTAVQVLAAQGQPLPLYGYALREGLVVSEVLGECLRSLTGLPPSLLTPLVERYGDSQDEIVLLGLFDLILAHEAHAAFDDVVLDFLRETRLYNIYRYLVSAIIASRRDELIAPLESLLREERDRLKAEVLAQALELR